MTYTPNSSVTIDEKVIRADFLKYYVKRALEDFAHLKSNEEKFETILNFYSKRELLVMLFAVTEEYDFSQKTLEGGEDEPNVN